MHWTARARAHRRPSLGACARIGRSSTDLRISDDETDVLALLAGLDVQRLHLRFEVNDPVRRCNLNLEHKYKTEVHSSHSVFFRRVPAFGIIGRPCHAHTSKDTDRASSRQGHWKAALCPFPKRTKQDWQALPVRSATSFVLLTCLLVQVIVGGSTRRKKMARFAGWPFQFNAFG